VIWHDPFNDHQSGLRTPPCSLPLPRKP
jgi:hypothetical protein